jgi:hypothetical protein
MVLHLSDTDKQVLRDCINIIKGTLTSLPVHQDYANETIAGLRRMLKADEKKRQKEMF